MQVWQHMWDVPGLPTITPAVQYSVHGWELLQLFSSHRQHNTQFRWQEHEAHRTGLTHRQRVQFRPGRVHASGLVWAFWTIHGTMGVISLFSSLCAILSYHVGISAMICCLLIIQNLTHSSTFSCLQVYLFSLANT